MRPDCANSRLSATLGGIVGVAKVRPVAAAAIATSPYPSRLTIYAMRVPSGESSTWSMS